MSAGRSARITAVRSPQISVVIPTRGREERLRRALAGVAGQTLPPDAFEVVVVRAEATGPLADAPPGLPVRFLELRESRGAAMQRNAGWRAARAPLVAFMDDDCRPAPDWLEQLLRAADQRSDRIVQGRTEPDPEEASDLYGLARSLLITGPTAWFETANILYPRALLERLGGFDESFPHAWGEDTDLGLRALEAGADRRYADGALVWHAVHRRTLPSALREALQRDGMPALIARHPSHRRALDLGIFARRAHALLVLALIGAVVFRRRPLLALLAAYPYLRRHVDPRKGWLRAGALIARDVPQRLPVDLFEVAALARSSIRHRTLVL